MLERFNRPVLLPLPLTAYEYAEWRRCRVGLDMPRGDQQALLLRSSPANDDAAALVDVILRSRPHPEQGLRSCIGILGLAQRHGAERVDAARARALARGTRSCTAVAAISRNRRDQPASTAEAPSLPHENIRGPGSCR